MTSHLEAMNFSACEQTRQHVCVGGVGGSGCHQAPPDACLLFGPSPHSATLQTRLRHRGGHRDWEQHPADLPIKGGLPGSSVQLEEL